MIYHRGSRETEKINNSASGLCCLCECVKQFPPLPLLASPTENSIQTQDVAGRERALIPLRRPGPQREESHEAGSADEAAEQPDDRGRSSERRQFVQDGTPTVTRKNPNQVQPPDTGRG